MHKTKISFTFGAKNDRNVVRFKVTDRLDPNQKRTATTCGHTLARIARTFENQSKSAFLYEKKRWSKEKKPRRQEKRRKELVGKSYASSDEEEEGEEGIEDKQGQK